MTDDPSPQDSPPIKPRRTDPSGRRADLLLEESRLAEVVQAGKVPDPEQSWSSPQSPRRRTILLSALALTLLALLAVGIPLAYKFLASSKKPAVPLPQPASLLPPNFMETSNAAEIRASTEAAIRGFMNASTDAQRCQFVLGGTSVEQRMTTFHQRPDAATPAGFGALLEVGHAAFAGIPIQVASASEANQQVGWSFILLPLRDRMVIDWEASVAYGTRSWADFIGNTHADPADMRVYLKRLSPPDPLPNLHYYEVSARADNGKALATVPADTTLATLLSATVPPGASQPVHLRLQWQHHDPSPPTLEIIALIHNFWIDTERWKASLHDTL